MELTIGNWILIAIGCIFLIGFGFYLIGLIILKLLEAYQDEDSGLEAEAEEEA